MVKKMSVWIFFNGIGESEMKVKVFNCRPVIMQKVQGIDRGKNADRIRQLEIMKFKRLRHTDVIS